MLDQEWRHLSVVLFPAIIEGQQAQVTPGHVRTLHKGQRCFQCSQLVVLPKGTELLAKGLLSMPLRRGKGVFGKSRT